MNGAEWSRDFLVAKRDADQQLVFGWLSVATDADGTPVVDSQDDVIDPTDLEKAAYQFMLDSRSGDVMHKERTVAKVVESMVFTVEKFRAMGIPEGTLPQGWWIGLRVTDQEVWKRVTDGELKAFSIGGLGRREDLAAA